MKNKKTIAESLNSFIAGEMLEGDNAYMCRQCNKKVDTLKRVCIKRLPSTVIFHLKRFEYDFELQDKIKVGIVDSHFFVSSSFALCWDLF